MQLFLLSQILRGQPLLAPPQPPPWQSVMCMGVKRLLFYRFLSTDWIIPKQISLSLSLKLQICQCCLASTYLSGIVKNGKSSLKKCTFLTSHLEGWTSFTIAQFVANCLGGHLNEWWTHIAYFHRLCFVFWKKLWVMVWPFIQWLFQISMKLHSAKIVWGPALNRFGHNLSFSFWP